MATRRASLFSVGAFFATLSALQLPPLPVGALAPPAPRSQPDGHALYVEGLGRGGLWGLGYDHAIHSRFCIGGVFSYSVLAGDHVAMLAPYAGAYLVKRRQHRFFAQLGPQLAFVRTPSPVPEWPGRSAFGVAGALSTGYEYRRGVLVRVALLVTAGRGKVAPWLGVSVGWAQ